MGWTQEAQDKADRETDELNALGAKLGYGPLLYYIAYTEDKDDVSPLSEQK